ncbi:MAG: NAD(P)-dependent oxidoreductase [Alphaproteobacteria bacterium]|nr:NAD(P)-dependent oxidoreductase [Alphaproteobacteria bacterium]
MRILVTGASGFSGRVIARRLLDEGHHVVAHHRRRPLPDDLAMAEPVRADLVAIDAVPPGLDAVVHAAATSPPTGRSDAVPTETLIRDNALATAHLIRLCAEAGVGRMIYLSSLSVLGRIDAPSVDENTHVSDPDPYGTSKLMGEQALAASGLAGLAIRLPAVIGSGAARNWPVQVKAAIAAGEVVRVYNADGPFNNVVHVADLAEWIARVLAAGGPEDGFRAVPVASAEPVSVRQAVAALAAGMGRAVHLDKAAVSRLGFSIDIGSARSLGFTPMTTVDALTRFGGEGDLG